MDIKILLMMVFNGALFGMRINRIFRFIIFLVQQPPIDHGLLIHEVSRSHSTTHHSQ
jgi:hypothetical protein